MGRAGFEPTIFSDSAATNVVGMKTAQVGVHRARSSAHDGGADRIRRSAQYNALAMKTSAVEAL
jgi:hypothetical protein